MLAVRFIGAEGSYQSIETQAVRIHRSLERVGADRVKSLLSLLPQDFFKRRGLFRRLPVRAMEDLLEGVDILVVVKSSLFREFVGTAPVFRDLCRRRGTVLVSNPCDGPGADGGDTADVFSETIADHVFALSRTQKEAIARKRPEEDITLIGHASRLERPIAIDYRDPVRKVVWENAVHHNPRFDPRKAGMAREKYQELEDMLAATLRARGAELVFIDAWRETQTYEEWERILLDADIAVECKALGNVYVDYQSQKPAVKVLNYMALGLPVICDSLPAYRDLGAGGRDLLFADTVEEWRSAITRLLDDRKLRVSLGTNARKAAEPYGIESICGRYLDCFERLSARATARASSR
jgi:glycosyltransferase involved in cell wall biosynthesis